MSLLVRSARVRISESPLCAGCRQGSSSVPCPTDRDPVAAEILRKADMQWLVQVTDEMGQEAQRQDRRLTFAGAVTGRQGDIS
jgi:hypothetical protein